MLKVVRGRKVKVKRLGVSLLASKALNPDNRPYSVAVPEGLANRVEHDNGKVQAAAIDDAAEESRFLDVMGNGAPALMGEGSKFQENGDETSDAVERLRRATEHFTQGSRIHMRSFSAPNIRIALTPDSIETAAKRVIERPRSFKGLYSAASLVPKPDAGSAFDNALDAQRKVLRTKRTKQFRKVARRRYIRKKKKGEITREHEFYNLTYCMMIGIRYTVGRSEHLL